MQTQNSAAQSIQNLLASEQQLLARRGAAHEALTQIDDELGRVRAAIQGVQLGQRLAAESVQQEDGLPEPTEPITD